MAQKNNNMEKYRKVHKNWYGETELCGGSRETMVNISTSDRISTVSLYRSECVHVLDWVRKNVKKNK